jgi:sigma-B regulation protein RsbU (phosphoserine phosphatase)
MPGGPVDLVADLEPAQEVSGDFYDFIRLDESRLALLVADVSGKGMPAALFMSMVRALLRQIAKSAKGPADMLMQLNKALAPDNPKFMFVTVLLGIYQVKSGDFIFSRAGHPAPLLRRASGAIQEVESDPGCLIGIEEDCPPLQETALRLETGDTIVFFTDGVTEAAEPKAGLQFGCRRLLESIQRLPASAPLRDWISALKDDLEKYCHTGGPQDDVTLLLLRHGRAN